MAAIFTGEAILLVVVLSMLCSLDSTYCCNICHLSDNLASTCVWILPLLYPVRSVSIQLLEIFYIVQPFGGFYLSLSFKWPVASCSSPLMTAQF